MVELEISQFIYHFYYVNLSRAVVLEENLLVKMNILETGRTIVIKISTRSPDFKVKIARKQQKKDCKWKEKWPSIVVKFKRFSKIFLHFTSAYFVHVTPLSGPYELFKRFSKICLHFTPAYLSMLRHTLWWIWVDELLGIGVITQI